MNAGWIWQRPRCLTVAVTDDPAWKAVYGSMGEPPAMSVPCRAQSALDDSPIYELRSLCVEQTGGGLLISGQVSSFYHKQLAQEVVRAVAGKFEVVNSICVEQV